MALDLRQTVSLTQQLIMTPQLQQAIKLLQLSRLELLENINQEIETNPVREELADNESDGETDSYINRKEEEKQNTEQESTELPEVTIEERVRDDIDWENYLYEYNTGGTESVHETKEAPPFENIIATKSSLCSHLTWQLNMGNLDEAQKEIGAHIIGNLNEDGYLDLSVEDLSRLTGYSTQKASETIAIIQRFDPIGVASRDMRECLLIQARFHNFGGTIVEKLIMDHLGDLENKKYDRIAKKLSIDIKDVLSALTILKGFDPRPGRVYSEEDTIYIIPDIYIFKVADGYEIVQNEDGLPKLKINSYYKRVLRNKQSLNENARAYIQEKLKSAAWLIKSIHQRQRTIYRVTKSIVKFQKDFLDMGISHLKPLVLRDVAEDIEMHESTISRVTTNKYVFTPQGTFELKYFFNSSINMVGGDVIASESVKEYIRSIIKTENKKKPRSDQDISDILMKRDIRVARRTVAKYRELMGILTSRKRKNPY